MKVNYQKTIIKTKNGEVSTYIEISKTICCDEMRESFDDDDLRVVFGSDSASPHGGRADHDVCLSVIQRFGDGDRGCYKIEYCPWCGEKIETTEEHLRIIKEIEKTKTFKQKVYVYEVESA